MKKCFVLVLLFSVMLINLTGCGKKVEEKVIEQNTESEKIETNNNLEKLIENNTKQIEETNKKNQELEEKIVALEEKAKALKEKITTLEKENKSLKNTSKTRYDELKKLTNKSAPTTVTSNRNTISKSKLVGTWKNSNYNWTFNSNGKMTNSPGSTPLNYQIVGNWIVVNGSSALYYEYINGKLYISDDGPVLSK